MTYSEDILILLFDLLIGFEEVFGNVRSLLKGNQKHRWQAWSHIGHFFYALGTCSVPRHNNGTRLINSTLKPGSCSYNNSQSGFVPLGARTPARWRISHPVPSSGVKSRFKYGQATTPSFSRYSIRDPSCRFRYHGAGHSDCHRCLSRNHRHNGSSAPRPKTKCQGEASRPKDKSLYLLQSSHEKRSRNRSVRSGTQQ